MNYELRGAYLIGSDLRTLISEHEITKIEPFFDLFHDPYDAFLEHVAQRQLSGYPDKEGNSIIDLIKTFKQGLGIHS